MYNATAIEEVREPQGDAWALHMNASSREEPCRLAQALTGAILGCGGWVLSRGATNDGLVSILFEFERKACLDIYTVLVAAGLDLNPKAHLSFTELCHCTHFSPLECGNEIASIDLEIATNPIEVPKPFERL